MNMVSDYEQHRSREHEHSYTVLKMHYFRAFCEIGIICAVDNHLACAQQQPRTLKAHPAPYVLEDEFARMANKNSKEKPLSKV
ncbi:hypothetical protein RvY_06169 [Ramazzottius varieornatus]|uniref:Uncharacterized protein n=1 Tax=Ramazzottius varieornatus TaxID=947166 RepID=A0A1D1UXN1_RAMVA|nr:hypothetical protein RvY_06169 [Ramazzottius varieornatus]